MVDEYWKERLTGKPKEETKKYIPKDLQDSIDTLIGMLFDEDYLALKSMTGEEIAGQHHFLGRQLRNEWGLWAGSRLAKWFNEKGIHHADDMSGIILTSFWREINSELIKLDEQIKEYQDFWKKQNADKTEQSE